VDPVYMAPDKIQRVLYNLLDNALRYTPSAGVITVQACRETEAVRVDVHNSGSTIAPEHVPHVFETFYRVESARVQSADGRRSTGLGLAMARQTVSRYGGKLEIKSTRGAGTTVKISLPVDPGRKTAR